MSDKPAQRIAVTLESVFKRIHRERMIDMPMVNPKLAVHAIGFQPWQAHYIGVLSTPWFMNLMLLPGPDEDWSELPELGKQTHGFPSGQYEFITGSEPEIGKYQMCSLFSPMFEFADDPTAVDTAEHIINALMLPENADEQHLQARDIQRIWQGDAPAEDEAPAAGHTSRQVANNTDAPAPTLEQRLQKPISRRRLLRGLLDDGGTD